MTPAWNCVLDCWRRCPVFCSPFDQSLKRFFVFYNMRTKAFDVHSRMLVFFKLEFPVCSFDKVSDLFAVNLHVAYFHHELAFFLIKFIEYRFKRERHYSSIDGVGLTSACLSITKDGARVPFKKVVDYRFCTGVVQVVLWAVWPKQVIKGKHLSLAWWFAHACFSRSCLEKSQLPTFAYL